MLTAELYILCGFLAFVGLLLVALIGFQIRLFASMGRLEAIIPRVETLEEQVGNLREQVAEIRGILLGLNSRIDLIMRHHHNEAGQVVITPEEVAAD